MVAAFVFNDAWFGVLITLHVFGAIVGLGPTFAFAILGPMAEKAGPAGVWILESMEKIERGIVLPVLLVVVLSTGILMIFNRGLDKNFFSWQRGWLIGGILAYALALGLVFTLDLPAMSTAIRLAKEGRGGTPEFIKAVTIAKTLGPVLSILAVTIIVLMVWKPGGGCGPLYRC